MEEEMKMMITIMRVVYLKEDDMFDLMIAQLAELTLQF